MQVPAVPGGFGGGNGTNSGSNSTSAPSEAHPSVTETPPTNNGCKVIFLWATWTALAASHSPLGAVQFQSTSHPMDPVKERP